MSGDNAKTGNFAASKKRGLLSKVLDALDRGSLWVGMGALVIIVIQMGIEVILRYAFNIAIHYLEMSCLYFVFYVALIPMGAIYRHREHLAVTMLPDYLRSHHKTTALRTLTLILILMALAFATISLYVGITQTHAHILLKTTYFEELWAHAGRVPIIVTFITIPVGFLLFLIFVLEDLVKSVRGVSE